MKLWQQSTWAHELEQIEPLEFLRLLLPPLSAEDRTISRRRALRFLLSCPAGLRTMLRPKVFRFGAGRIVLP